MSLFPVRRQLHKVARVADWEEALEVLLLHTRDMLNEIIQYHTGQPLERIKHDTERDFFMSAQEAVEYGIVDEVLTLSEK